MFRRTDRRRWLATALAGAVLATTAVVATTSIPAAAAPVTVVDGSITWGVKSSFRTYITGSIAQGNVTTSGGATQASGNGVFTFGGASGTYDNAASAASVAADGSVRFLGFHCGVSPRPSCQLPEPEPDLDLVISDVRVTVAGTTGSIIVDATLNGTPTDDAAIGVLDLTAVTPTGSDPVTYTNVPATLTPAGVNLFALGGSPFYAVGDALDPISFTVDLEDPVAPPASGNLQWSVSQAAIQQGSLNGAKTAVAPATLASNLFTFTAQTASYDQATGEVDATFGGALILGNNVQGGYKVRFANPVFSLESDGSGKLSADVAVCPPAGPPGCTTYLTEEPDVTIVTFSKGSATIVDTGTQYTITVTPPWATVGSKYDADLLAHFDAIGGQANALKNWFQATGTNPTTDAQKVPNPITLSFTHPAVASQDSIQVTASIDDGPLTISIGDTTVALGELLLNSGATALTASGVLPNVTVTDQRAADPGWNVSAQLTTFTGVSGETLPASSLGWTPALVSKAASQDATAGAAKAPGTGLSASELGRASAGAGRGTAVYNAGLSMSVPTNAAADDYSATLTLTAI